MDKYIKMLLIHLSAQYKVTLNHKMFYSEDKERLVNIFSLTIKQGKEILLKQDYFSKRDVVLALSEWKRK